MPIVSTGTPSEAARSAGPKTSASSPCPAAAIRSASTSPRAVSIWASRPTPSGSRSAAPDTSSTDSTLGSTTTSGRALAAARRSSSHHGVERPLTRSAVVRPSGPRPSAATAIPRARSLSSAATASSRSTITSSAASDGAFASIRSLEAGTVRQERRGRAGARNATPPHEEGVTALLERRLAFRDELELRQDVEGHRVVRQAQRRHALEARCERCLHDRLGGLRAESA